MSQLDRAVARGAFKNNGKWNIAHSKWKFFLEKYTRQGIIDLYKKHLDVFEISAELNINYSTLRRITNEYKINFKQIRAELERSGEIIHPSKGIKRSEESKAKQSETRKRLIKEGKIDTSSNIKAMCAAYKPVYQNTSIELELKAELKNRGVIFEDKQRRINFKEGSFVHPDIFIAPNICIFADGDYWHNKEDQIKRDIFVNEQLTSLGYKVYRFWEAAIHSSPSRCIDQITELNAQ